MKSNDLINIDEAMMAGGREAYATETTVLKDSDNSAISIVRNINNLVAKLTPENVNAYKQIIQSKTSELSRMLSPQSKSGIEMIEQGMPEDDEYDDEAGMADNNLETLRRTIDGIDEIIQPGDNLPEWCQEKIAQAKGMLVNVWDYMKSEEDRAMSESNPGLYANIHAKRERIKHGSNERMRSPGEKGAPTAKAWKAAAKTAKNEGMGHAMMEGDENLSIGQQMARDGITYSPEKENELIGLMAQYMKKEGMSSKAIRYYLNYDEDFIPDQLSELPKKGVAEGLQRVDSLVTDALKIMQGPTRDDAEQALKTVLGDRELNGRYGFYNFYIRQILDMYRQKQGVAEGSLTTKNVAPVKARPLSTERPKGEWDPIHGKAPKKGTLKYDMWKQKVAQDKKGVAEGYIFKGGFPFDVDHMPGSVIRNRDETTDIVKTKNKDKWDDEVDRINDEVFDDMSDFRTDSKGETVTGNSAVWAKWDNKTQTGWINRKGQPLKPWPVKEQGVAEAAKWRDPKYKDRLYTQEPGDSDEYDDIGYGYDFPERPDNDPGQKRRIGGVGSEFDHNDPLKKGQGIGRTGIKHSLNTAGKRKGLPSRDQITSLKGSIRDAHGKHHKPNLPEQGVAEGYTQSPEELKRIAQGWAEKYPNIDELVARAEQDFMANHKDYQHSSRQAYYQGKEAHDKLIRLRQIKDIIDSGKKLDESVVPNYANMLESKLMEFSSCGGTGGIATSMSVGNPNAGGLFGGSYSNPNNPFKKTGKKRSGKMLKR